MKLAHTNPLYAGLKPGFSLLALLSLVSASNAQATPGLLPLPQYDLGGGYSGRMEAIDLNGDGRKDLIMTLGNPSAIGVAVANAQGGFNTIVQYNTAFQPDSMAVADVNNDGKVDIALTDRNAGKIVVMLGGANATFGVPVTYNSVAGISDIQLADVTGDNKLDLLYCIYGQTGFRVRPGNGAGSFLAETNYSTGAQLNEVVFCDVNGDGKKDLVGSLFTSPNLIVCLGSTPGVYGSEIYTSTANWGDSLTFGDINQDGKQDVIFSQVSNATVSYALGQANGTFGPSVSLGTQFCPHARIVDVNNDTKPDVILTNNNQPFASVRTGNGLGVFAPEMRVWGTSTTTDTVLADLNGDGILDIAIAGGKTISLCPALSAGIFNIPPTYSNGFNYATDIIPAKLFGSSQDLIVGQNSPGLISILQNAGNGTYTNWGTLSMGSSFYTLAVGDLNSDGYPDVVAGSSNNSYLSIRFGTPGPTPFGALTTLSVPFGAYQVKLADMNNDNALDFIVTSVADGHVTILWGDGNGGTFGTSIYAVGTSPTACAIGDFNGDGVRDFAVSLNGSNTLPIYTNNGAGGFIASSKTLPGASSYCIAGDLNWDGCDELVVNYEPKGFSLLTGSPAGLGNPVNTILPVKPIRMLITDVTSDGNPDLTCITDGGTVLVKRGNGLGALGTIEYYASMGYSPTALAVGDSNADGRADLFVANTSGSAHHIAVISTQSSSVTGVGLFGFGTPGCRGTHGVRANSVPKVGNANFRLLCTNAPEDSLGLALITNFADTLGSDVFNVGIVNHIQIPFMDNLIWADAYSDLGGNGGAMFPIPADPLFAGVDFYGQFVWLWSPGVMCDPSTYNLSASKGVSITVQP